MSASALQRFFAFDTYLAGASALEEIYVTMISFVIDCWLRPPVLF
jgi:hypothetical protein